MQLLLALVNLSFQSSILPPKSAIKTKKSQRAAMNVLTSHCSDLNRTLFENPDLAALWIRALQSFDELDGTSS